MAKSKQKTAKAKRKPAKANAPKAKPTKAKPPKAKKPSSKAGGARKGKGKVVLLAGGNPQIAKGEGDGPVQAYIAAIPGWKSALAARIDALVVAAVPHVKKAIKWNSAFYGVEGQGWLMNFHVFTNYLKVAFFKGASLDPMPPGTSKHAEVRYADIREGELDDAQMTDWITRAAALPGWMG